MSARKSLEKLHANSDEFFGDARHGPLTSSSSFVWIMVGCRNSMRGFRIDCCSFIDSQE